MSPYAAGRPCPGVGPRRGSCPNLIRGSERNCETCAPYVKAKNKRYDKTRGNSGERGYDAQWAKIRARKLAKDPLCEMCMDDAVIRAAVLVHHIDGDAFNNDDDNHMSLCHYHHEMIHGPNRWAKTTVEEKENK